MRKVKADGADVIKLFATAGSSGGGRQTMTDEQIQAACGEAKAVGLRAVVHALTSPGAKAASLACGTSIEHGDFLNDDTLKLLEKRWTNLDPNFLGPPRLTWTIAPASVLPPRLSTSLKNPTNIIGGYFAKSALNTKVTVLIGTDLP